MIMTETASTDETATSTPLPISPTTQNNNGNGEVKPMEVDLTDAELSSASADNGAAKTNGGADLGTPSPGLLNTPKSSTLMNSDCFKTPEPRTPTSSAKKRKRLTPEEKSLREKERLDKRRKLEEEKQKKEEERLEKARQKEAERLKKEEEKRLLEEERKREREKKEEERKRLEEEKRVEREKKEEERKKLEEEKRLERQKKEDERLKKEEERKKKEDEKRRQVEEKEKELKKVEEKKEKQKQFFTNFFQKSSAPKVKIVDDSVVYLGTGSPSTGTGTITLTPNKACAEKISDSASAVTEESSKSSCLFNPLPFQIKTDMAVAPLCRREKLRTEEVSKLDSIIGGLDTSRAGPDPIVNGGTGDAGKQNPSATDFLKRLKDGKGRREQKTEVSPSKDSEVEVQILNDDAEKPKNVAGYIKWRMKLLQFHDNRRPAYWGTWKRKGKKIKARRPLAQEEDLDYEFDSDDEWEDEPEDAEEIENSDKENEKEDQEDADGEDDEEGWMVPHGYLSDTERDGGTGDIESMKNREKEFYKSLKEKTLVGLPFIETHDLSYFAIRICPVFKSADPVKPVRIRKRSKPVKKELNEVETKPTEEIIHENETTKVEESKSGRKSIRSKKVPKNDNPYAKPPSGFLALDLPSDDEEDMDYEEESSSSSSDEHSSGVDENEEDKSTNNATDSDMDDLFIPIKVPKVKKPPSSS